jgi:SAM-dependent methyltransferase
MSHVRNAGDEAGSLANGSAGGFSTLHQPTHALAQASERIFSTVLRSGEAFMHGVGPDPLPLRVDDWRARADNSDLALLEHCEGPTLDIGCGPGRMAAELFRRGLHATGIDVAVEAVRMARSRGVVALLADVFAPLPGEGLWHTVLLADGNIGIGGDPLRLLRRVHEVLDTGGRVVAELAPCDATDGRHRVTVETDGVHSSPFWWGVVTSAAIAGLAARAGFAACEVHTAGDRAFAVIHRDG